MLFEQLNLNPAILKALSEEGYQKPTPIQAQAIPIVMEGGDLLGCAQTGTGKTAAFALPILHHLAERTKADRPGVRPIRCLILTPTRELAVQIDESFGAYGRHLPLRHTVVFGGVSAVTQAKILRSGVDVLTATPGRLLDLCNQGVIDLSSVEHFILDEADRMLDMGFLPDVRRVISQLPAERQTLLFSATMPEEIAGLADRILRNPQKVAVTPVSSTVDKISQTLCLVGKRQKRDLLAHLLQDESIVSVLVFTRTKHGADKVVKDLVREGHQADAIHGNKSQNARQYALKRFKAGVSRILVATDIAARGIDIDELSHVINYELPDEPESYVHRIGRTGRAGLSGTAISFCEPEERVKLRQIERLIGRKIEVASHPFEDSYSQAEEEKPLPPSGKAAAGPRGMRQEMREGRPGGRGDGRGARQDARPRAVERPADPLTGRPVRVSVADEGGTGRPRTDRRMEGRPRQDSVGRRSEGSVGSRDSRGGSQGARDARDGGNAGRRDSRDGGSQGGYRGTRGDGAGGSQGTGRDARGGSQGGYRGSRGDGAGGSQGTGRDTRVGSQGGYRGTRDGGAGGSREPRGTYGSQAGRSSGSSGERSGASSDRSAGRASKPPEIERVREQFSGSGTAPGRGYKTSSSGRNDGAAGASSAPRTDGIRKKVLNLFRRKPE